MQTRLLAFRRNVQPLGKLTKRFATDNIHGNITTGGNAAQNPSVASSNLSAPANKGSTWEKKTIGLGVGLSVLGAAMAAYYINSESSTNNIGHDSLEKDTGEKYDSVKECLSYLRGQARSAGRWGEGRYAPSSLGGWNAWKTTDPETRRIVKENFADIEQDFALDATTIPSASSSRTATHIVSDNDVRAQNPDFKGSTPHSVVCSGGISALWSAYIASVLYKKGLIKGEPPVYIVPEDIKHSASKGSSGQFHVSHAMPMYTDSEFDAFNIFWQSLKRNFSTVDPNVDNFMIGEINLRTLFTDPKVMQVGLGYLANQLQYNLDKLAGRETIADQTIKDAIKSGVIMDNASRELGEELLLRKNTIRVAYNDAETREMEETQAQMQKYGIVCKKISSTAALEKSGSAPKIGDGGSIWEVEGDGNVSPKLFDILCKAIKDNGGKVIESGMVSTILHDKKTKKTTGVVVDCGNENGIPKQEIIRTDAVYTSFGANAEYVADNGISLNTSIEPIIPATGYSAYLLVEGEIKVPVDSNNSHFTPFKTATTKDGKTYTIVKTTCGGAIGTPNFNIDHAENSLWYARNVIFPDKKVEVISVRPCSRPINSLNSGRLTEVLPGNVVASGFGGKGITDGAAFAYLFLDTLFKGEDNAAALLFLAQNYLQDNSKTSGNKKAGTSIPEKEPEIFGQKSSWLLPSLWTGRIQSTAQEEAQGRKK